MRGMRVVSGVTVAVLLAVGACSKQEPAPSEASAVQEAADVVSGAAAPPPAEPAPTAARAPQTEPSAPIDAQAQLQSAAVTQADGERQFIRTANARFRVGDVYRSALAIEDLAGQHGGFVTRNDIRADIDRIESRPSGDGKLIELATYIVNGSLQVRVPSARAQAFLRALAAQIEFLDSRTFAAEDAQFELLRQQLAYARYQQAQAALGEVAEGRGHLGEKTEAVDARTQSQSQRDEALIARKTFEDRVAFATIDLALYQSPQIRRTERLDVEAIVRRDGPGFFSRLWHSASVGWYGLLGLLVALMQVWPLWLLLVAGAWLLRRWRRPRAQ